MFLRKEQVTARSRYLSSRVKNTFLYEEKLKYLFLKGCFIMNEIRIKYKVSFGPVTGLLITSLAYAILVDASLRYDNYKQHKKLIKLGESVKSLGETLTDVNKKQEKESE